jgi:hypothetical protein
MRHIDEVHRDVTASGHHEDTGINQNTRLHLKRLVAPAYD